MRLPWRDPWREEDFNDALAWILEAEPLCAVALAERLDVGMFVSRPVTCTVRRGEAERGRPDLVITSGEPDAPSARIVVELKTRRDTALTPHEAEAYPSYFEGLDATNSRFVVVGPVGYAQRHALPESARFLELGELREIIASQLRTDLQRWLLDDIWTHFFGIEVARKRIGALLAEGADVISLFLRELSGRASTFEDVRSSRIAGSRDRSDLGFSVYGADDRHLGWIGFYRDGKKGRGRLGVNLTSKKALKLCRGLGGEVDDTYNEYDYVGHWVPELKSRFSPDDVMNAGLATLFAAWSKHSR